MIDESWLPDAQSMQKDPLTAYAVWKIRHVETGEESWLFSEFGGPEPTLPDGHQCVYGRPWASFRTCETGNIFRAEPCGQTFTFARDGESVIPVEIEPHPPSASVTISTIDHRPLPD